jgi:hypothetical protein
MRVVGFVRPKVRARGGRAGVGGLGSFGAGFDGRPTLVLGFVRLAR